MVVFIVASQASSSPPPSQPRSLWPVRRFAVDVVAVTATTTTIVVACRCHCCCHHCGLRGLRRRLAVVVVQTVSDDPETESLRRLGSCVAASGSSRSGSHGACVGDVTSVLGLVTVAGDWQALAGQWSGTVLSTESNKNKSRSLLMEHVGKLPTFSTFTGPPPLSGPTRRTPVLP
ncbi:hypothetical protein EDB84DRAFT_284001 [Lactarius hengduanensis]|nr:hypothetical protein EDB84DRAFT_284001 [Lactarius hengduanensis]